MNRPIREIVGERVLLLRRRARLSQPELAQQADMSVTTLNRVENAHQSLYMEKIVALATALGTTADYLLGLSDDPRTSHRQDSLPGTGKAGKSPAQGTGATPSQPSATRRRTRKAAPVG
jgi:transcriptional regulator with XRE-family HTH domain